MDQTSRSNGEAPEELRSQLNRDQFLNLCSRARPTYEYESQVADNVEFDHAAESWGILRDTESSPQRVAPFSSR